MLCSTKHGEELGIVWRAIWVISYVIFLKYLDDSCINAEMCWRINDNTCQSEIYIVHSMHCSQLSAIIKKTANNLCAFCWVIYVVVSNWITVCTEVFGSHWIVRGTRWTINYVKNTTLRFWCAKYVIVRFVTCLSAQHTCAMRH